MNPMKVETPQESMPYAVNASTKRLNLNLSLEAFEELSALAKTTARSMTELVRLGLGLVKIALEESKAGNKLMVTTASGKHLREIVFPR